MTVYRRHHSENMERPIATPGPVLFWDDTVHGQAVIFSCPCGEREVYVTTHEGHRFEWDAEDRLTIHGSCGYAAKPDLGRSENWCHFLMAGGVAEICNDSQCPGASL